MQGRAADEREQAKTAQTRRNAHRIFVEESESNGSGVYRLPETGSFDWSCCVYLEAHEQTEPDHSGTVGPSPRLTQRRSKLRRRGAGRALVKEANVFFVTDSQRSRTPTLLSLSSFLTAGRLFEVQTDAFAICDSTNEFFSISNEESSCPFLLGTFPSI